MFNRWNKIVSVVLKYDNLLLWLKNENKSSQIIL